MKFKDFLFSTIIAVIVVIFSSLIAMADEKSVEGGLKIWKKAKCGYCHGIYGDGKGDPRSPGNGANLRETQFDKEGLIEIVSCGIPGTEMPYFHRSAYKKPEICWDMLEGDMGEDMPKTHQGKKISEKSIIKVVDYIVAKIKGKGSITLEQCEEYFRVGSKACDRFK